MLRKNVYYNVMLSFTQILFPLVTFPYASRILGPGAMGAVSFADNFTTYFLILSGLGIPLYGLREIAKVKNDPNLLAKTFLELFLINLGFALLSVVALLLISTNVSKLNNDLALYQIGMFVVLANTFVAEWFFQGIEQFRYITIRTILLRIFTIILLFFLVKGPADRTIYYGLNALTTLLAGGMNFYIITKKLKFNLNGLSFKKHFRPLFLILASAMVTTGYLVFDTIILGFLTNEVTVGYYAASMRIAKLSLSVLGAVSLALIPRFSVELHNEDQGAAKALVHKSLGFVVFLSVPIAVGIFCLATEFIYVFAGQAYQPAVRSLKVLSFLVILIGLAQVFSNQILLALKQEKKILYAAIAGVVVSLTVNFLLIPILGHTGAATSALLTELTVTWVAYRYAKRLFPIVFPFGIFWKSSLTSCLFFVVRYVVAQFTIIPLFVVIFTVALSVVVYLVIHLLVWKNRDLIAALSDYRLLSFLNRIK